MQGQEEPKEPRKSASRSPILRKKESPKKPERRVTFAEDNQDPSEKGTKMIMSISDARAQTTRLPNETKKKWKERVFKAARGVTE